MTNEEAEKIRAALTERFGGEWYYHASGPSGDFHLWDTANDRTVITVSYNGDPRSGKAYRGWGVDVFLRNEDEIASVVGAPTFDEALAAALKQVREYGEDVRKVEAFLAGTEPQPMQAPIPESIQRIARAMQSQDNRATANPLWELRVVRHHYGYNPDYADGTEWRHCDGFTASDAEAEKLEAEYQRTGKVPDEWARVGYRAVVEHHQTFLTQQGLDDYLAVNGHNVLPDRHVYVNCAYRNAEIAAVRDFLLSLPVGTDNPEDS